MPAVLVVAADVPAILWVSFAVASPKSARQALRDCVIRILTCNYVVYFCRINSLGIEQLTPLMSP